MAPVLDQRGHREPDARSGDGDRDAGENKDAASGAPDWSARAALATFVVYLVVAFFVLLLHFGEGHWFAGDEWGFLVGRSLSDPIGLLTPQNQHWSTVPIVIYQVLYALFGLDSYLPYMGVTIALHLTLVALLRVVMRRAGVGPWVATLVASIFVLFGTGEQNILLGVQISMVASMVFGLVQLVLADHDGAWNRRDWFGLAAGALAIMSSSIGIPMVVIVGIAVLIRRGWRAAALQTIPLGTLYVVWYVSQRGVLSQSPTGSADVAGIAGWVGTASVAVLDGLTPHPAVAALLVVIFVGGLALAWLPFDRDRFRRTAAGPAALLVGSLVLTVVIAFQRLALIAFAGPDIPRSSRYIAMATALALPALGVATDAVVRRWRWSAPLVAVVLLAGIPANIEAFSNAELFSTAEFQQSQRQFVLAVAASPLLREVPRDVRPDPLVYGPDLVTVGAVIDAVDQGKLQPATDVERAVRDKAEMRLRMSQSGFEAPLATASDCTTYREPLVFEPARGERFVLDGGATLSLGRDDGKYGTPIAYGSATAGNVITAQFDGMRIRVTPPGGQQTFIWCEPL